MLFAEALGATLLSVADLATEGVLSGLGVNSSTDRSFATGPDSGTTAKGERELYKVKNLTKGALTRIEMAGIMRINPFVGRGDGKENPSDFFPMWRWLLVAGTQPMEWILTIPTYLRLQYLEKTSTETERRGTRGHVSSQM